MRGEGEDAGVQLEQPRGEDGRVPDEVAAVEEVDRAQGGKGLDARLWVGEADDDGVERLLAKVALDGALGLSAITPQRQTHLEVRTELSKRVQRRIAHARMLIVDGREDERGDRRQLSDHAVAGALGHDGDRRQTGMTLLPDRRAREARQHRKKRAEVDLVRQAARKPVQRRLRDDVVAIVILVLPQSAAHSDRADGPDHAPPSRRRRAAQS